MLGSTFLFFFFTTAFRARSSMADCPRIYSREEWGARPPKSVAYLENPVNWTIIHHAADAAPEQCYDFDSCAARVRSFQDLHMDVNGWDDIGYSFVIGSDGAAYEGRGWNRVGAHTLGYNSVGLGFCIIGNFMETVPNDAALDAVQRMIACGVEMGYIAADYKLIGHRQARATACPGDELYRVITQWPHWVQT